jgi:outer membrane protein
MRKFVVGLVAAVLALPAVATAQTPEHPWMVRARGIVIAPTAGTTTLGDLPLQVGTGVTAEIDISRRFGRYLGAELVLATAAHEVRVEDGPSLGSIHILPPTLLLQFHVPTAGKVHPYIGAGVNMTMIYDKTGVLETPGLALGDASELDLGTSFGFAGQVGVDIDLSPRAVFNLDAKYVGLKSKLEVDGTDLGDVRVNPVIIGVGFGYRF